MENEGERNEKLDESYSKAFYINFRKTNNYVLLASSVIITANIDKMG